MLVGILACGLATSFIEMLELADEYNMSLKAEKTHFGSPSAEFWGHTLTKDGSQMAEHNISPIARIANGASEG